MQHPDIHTPTLELHLLGAPQIRLNNRQMSNFVTRKAQALLIYIADGERVHRRDALAGFFWRDMPDDRAKNNLRRVLPNLRKLVGSHLLIDRDQVALNRSSPHFIDTQRFQNVLSTTQNAAQLTASSMALLEETLQLYRNEYLAGFYVRDAPAFEEWVLTQREHYRELAVRGFALLAEAQLQRHEYEAGLHTTRRLLELEPWYETGHYLQMQLLARTSQRSAALAQYQFCRTILADEFGAQPGAEMTTLYEQLQRAELTDAHAEAPARVSAPQAPGPRVDWGEVPRATLFMGRQPEKNALMRWLLEERCALVSILGTGGTGKTTLAAAVIRTLAGASEDSDADSAPKREAPFSHIIWRSLLNAPPLATILRTWLHVLSPASLVAIPDSPNEQLALLFDCLQQQRCLLVLDNVESILQGGDVAGQWRAGYEEYGLLIRRMGEMRHQSCLLLTSREQPLDVERLARDYPDVHTLSLAGLPTAPGVEVLRAAGLEGAREQTAALVQRYSGNPLALKLVAETICEIYGGNIGVFLQGETPIFDDIRAVLAQQFARLSALEQEVLFWLAVEREPVALSQLLPNWIHPPAQPQLLAALRSLQRRSLLEQHVAPDAVESGAQFTLQNVVMEYATERLLRALRTELESGQLDFLHRFGLRKASAREYIQKAQRRLLIEPTARWMEQRYGKAGAVQRLRTLCDRSRHHDEWARGYIGANVLHLMLYFQHDLAGEDFSHLSLRQADLRRAVLHNADLRAADLTSTRFADDFGMVWAVEMSPDGQFLAAATDHNITIWHTSDFHIHAILQGHTSFIAAIAFAPDGHMLASASYDGSLRLWDLPSGALIHHLTPNAGELIDVAISPDGEWVAGGGDAGVIWVWHRQRAERIATLKTHAPIYALEFAPQGELVASVGSRGGNAGAVQRWDVATQTLLGSFSSGEALCLAMAVSTDGHTLVLGSLDGSIYLWNPHRDAPAAVLRGHMGWVLAVALSPDGRYAASGGADGTIRIWGLRTQQLEQVLTGHQGWVRSLTYARAGHHLVSGSYDQTVRMWHVMSGLEHRRMEGYPSWVNELVFSPDGRRLAGATLGGEVYLWCAKSLSRLHILREHDAPVRALAFSPDGQLMATGSDDGRAILWDVNTGKQRLALLGHQGFVRAIAFDHSGRYVATGSHDQTVRLWDMASGRALRILPHASTELMGALIFSPCHDLLVYGDTAGVLHLMDIPNGTGRQRITLSAPPTVLAFCPHGKRLACGARDGVITVWDLKEHNARIEAVERFQIQASERSAWRLLFSPDGDHLVWNEENVQVLVARVESGEISHRLPDGQYAKTVAFSADSLSLITDGPDHTLVIHDVLAGTERTRLAGHTVSLTAMATNPDKTSFASSDAGGTVRLWGAETNVALREIRLQGPYAGMDITGATGINEAQRAVLRALGASEKRFHDDV